MKPYKAYVIQEQHETFATQHWGDVWEFNSKRMALAKAKKEHEEYSTHWRYRVIERTESVVWEGKE
jgi:hypothetical protein